MSVPAQSKSSSSDLSFLGEDGSLFDEGFLDAALGAAIEDEDKFWDLDPLLQLESPPGEVPTSHEIPPLEQQAPTQPWLQLQQSQLVQVISTNAAAIPGVAVSFASDFFGCYWRNAKKSLLAFPHARDRPGVDYVSLLRNKCQGEYHTKNRSVVPATTAVASATTPSSKGAVPAKVASSLKKKASGLPPFCSDCVRLRLVLPPHINHDYIQIVAHFQKVADIPPADTIAGKHNAQAAAADLAKAGPPAATGQILPSLGVGNDNSGCCHFVVELKPQMHGTWKCNMQIGSHRGKGSLTHNPLMTVHASKAYKNAVALHVRIMYHAVSSTSAFCIASFQSPGFMVSSTRTLQRQQQLMMKKKKRQRPLLRKTMCRDVGVLCDGKRVKKGQGVPAIPPVSAPFSTCVVATVVVPDEKKSEPLVHESRPVCEIVDNILLKHAEEREESREEHNDAPKCEESREEHNHAPRQPHTDGMGHNKECDINTEINHNVPTYTSFATVRKHRMKSWIRRLQKWWKIRVDKTAAPVFSAQYPSIFTLHHAALVLPPASPLTTGVATCSALAFWVDAFIAMGYACAATPDFQVLSRSEVFAEDGTRKAQLWFSATDEVWHDGQTYHEVVEFHLLKDHEESSGGETARTGRIMMSVWRSNCSRKVGSRLPASAHEVKRDDFCRTPLRTVWSFDRNILTKNRSVHLQFDVYRWNNFKGRLLWRLLRSKICPFLSCKFSEMGKQLLSLTTDALSRQVYDMPVQSTVCDTHCPCVEV